MSIEFNNTLGKVEVSFEVIADVVGVATNEVAGVVGMASKNRLKDGVAELLKKENYSKGIIVRSNDEGINVDLHIIVLYGVKISEIAKLVQERVKFTLENTLGVMVHSINIRIEDVRVDN